MKNFKLLFITFLLGIFIFLPLVSQGQTNSSQEASILGSLESLLTRLQKIFANLTVTNPQNQLAQVVPPAANHYMSADCPNNGDGTSWACASSPGGAGAFNDIPIGASTACNYDDYYWVLGDTYWIAGSSKTYRYGCFRNHSGSGPLFFKKATVAVHGSDTGWLDSYGTTQAVVSGFGLQMSNVTIDGSYRSGPEIRYGILVRGPGTYNLIANPNNVPVTGITLQYLDMSHTSYILGKNFAAIQAYGNGGNTYQFLYIHDVAGACIQSDMNTTSGLNNSIWQDSVCGNIGLENSIGGTTHNELLAAHGTTDNFIIRRNLFYDWHSTGGLMLMGNNQTNWKIYDNIFTQRTPGLGCGNGVIAGLSAGTGYQNILVYENTFANISSSCASVLNGGFGDFSLGGNEVKNNLFYNIAQPYNTMTVCTVAGCTKSHNWFYNVAYTLTGDDIQGSADPFTNDSIGDFTLTTGATPIDAALTLGSPYNVDKVGTSRPQGSGYDIGAYEYGSGYTPPPPDTTPPVAPSGIAVH